MQDSCLTEKDVLGGSVWDVMHLQGNILMLPPCEYALTFSESVSDALEQKWCPTPL